ncbi:hypothetical protein K439DRAFT_1031364 [Ramaria rubella]|nr:hypothetical protein K439DRAFT_1031364 [Ramaria rubella]
MEMHSYERLILGLEKLYTSVPHIILDWYEAIWTASTVSSVISQQMYQCVLSAVYIMRVALHLLAYFVQFDPPSFDAAKEFARVYLDPGATSDQKERLILESHLLVLEAHARASKISMGQKQLLIELLGVELSRQFAYLSNPSLHFLIPQPDIVPQCFDSSRTTTLVKDLDEYLPFQLYLHLLLYRRSLQQTTQALSAANTANKRLQVAVQRHDLFSEQLLVELLTLRKYAPSNTDERMK